MKVEAAHIYFNGPGDADIFQCLECLSENKEDELESFVSEP